MRADAIANALGGRRCGSGWVARCPAHDDRTPSLSIRNAEHGKVLVRCHAACDQRRVIDELRSRGLWGETDLRSFNRSTPRLTEKHQPDCDDARRSAAALAIWRSTIPARETLVETYLTSRGLLLPAPAALRFHGGL